jgi:hypothetical protein
MCKSTGVFTPTTAEGGNVLIHSTSKAGGFTAGSVDSAILMRACVLNGAANAPTGGNLGNIL